MRLKDLFEARVPGLKYTEKAKSKTDASIDKVILTLEGRDSERMTKLAYKYKKLDNIQKAIEKRRDEINAEVKTKMTDLFDAEDVFRTRVIETCSATMLLAKKSDDKPAQPERKVTEVDWLKVWDELKYLLDDELIVKAQSLLNKYTEIITIPATPAIPAKSPALKIEPKTADAAKAVAAESINEGFNWNSLTVWAKKYAEYFYKWGAAYDNKLNTLLSDIARLS